MHAGTRLTADQLAALAPGDAVVVETGADAGRLRHTTGTVLRTTDGQVVVRMAGPRGGAYVERYSRRDGLQVGRGARAALVTVDPAEADPANAVQRRQQQRIDALWRAWSRNRGDTDLLRELHEAIGERLGAG